jgi:5'-nucleotidase
VDRSPRPAQRAPAPEPGADERSRPRGVPQTRRGVRRDTEGVNEQVDPRGKQIFWIGGGEPVWEAIPGTDFHEVASGYVSVTPLHLDMTDHRALESLRAERPAWVDAEEGRELGR